MTVTSRSAWTQCAGSLTKAMNFAANPDHMISLPNPPMTEHIMGFKMDIFDNEFKPLVKLFNRAVVNEEIMSHFDDEECDRLHTFIDALKDAALEHAK